MTDAAASACSCTASCQTLCKQGGHIITNNNNNNTRNNGNKITENVLMLVAHDELGVCRTSLVSPEQPALCIQVSPTYTTVLTIT